MSAATPLGCHWSAVLKKLQSGQSGIRYMHEWEHIQGLSSLLAAPADELPGNEISRKKARSMSHVAIIASHTANKALENSRLVLSEQDKDNVGIAYGSSFGSYDQMVPFAKILMDGQARGISPTNYIKMMGHTAAVNLSLLLGFKGRLIPTSSACASGGQALGYAYETIKHGIHPVMIAGSAEELSPLPTAIFDSFFAASRNNKEPEQSAMPFSENRNGMVVGEGGATFVLEELEYALSRGAPILAEVVGFSTNMDGHHTVKQDKSRMKAVITSALASAELKPEQIDFINAHASGVNGDKDEAQVIYDIFGDRVPVASYKGHIGHTLGGCGSIESWLSINMMNQGWIAPTFNLCSGDKSCSNINFVTDSGLKKECNYIMNNNFAFGGVNVSVIFKRWERT